MDEQESLSSAATVVPARPSAVQGWDDGDHGTRSRPVLPRALEAPPAHPAAAAASDPFPLRHSGGQAEGRTERRLAALAFLDVVGYSRLMGVDEAATLRRWFALRDGLVEPRVAGWRGRVVDRAGDGLFVEFRSVLDAVLWAMDVQAASSAAPAAVA